MHRKNWRDDNGTSYSELTSLLSHNLRAPWDHVAPGSLSYIRCQTCDDSGQVTLVQCDARAKKFGRQLSVLTPKVRCPYKAECTSSEAGFVRPINKLLDQWRATAISGNDLIGSILYTAGPTTFYAGYYAPVCLTFVVIMLYFFRAIYVEFVTALPLNGGSYSAMLNTSGKRNAVVAACLSYLSYSATVVVSAATASSYLQRFWPEIPSLICTLTIVTLFALLMLLGIRESSIVASVIFVLHLMTLAILIGCMLAYAISTDFHYLVENYTWPGPANPAKAIIFGYSAGMLGITGFETTANYVQELRPGVFSKVLRNMWWLVAFINPTVCLLAFAVVPVDVLYCNNHTLEVTKNFTNAPLQVIANEMDTFLGGHGWLWKLIVGDAISVLCGGVLTGFVGVNGLLRRMTDDDILPQVFKAKLPVTGANWAIIILFGAVCITMILITDGDMLSISGVFAVSFVSVLALFCISNLFLKHFLPQLRSEQKAKWYTTLLCLICLIIAFVGNCLAAPSIVGYFAIYFTLFILIFYGLFCRTALIRACLQLTATRTWYGLPWLRLKLTRLLHYIEFEPVVFFASRLSLREMNVAIQKVLADELSRRLVIVHCYDRENSIPKHIEYNLHVLTNEYPNICVDIILLQSSFNPGSVRLVECILKIPPNRMFIACPSEDFPYNVAEIGGCRIIMSTEDIQDRRHILENTI